VFAGEIAMIGYVQHDRIPFAGKPSFLRQKLANGCDYPLADPNTYRLKNCLASYYAIISFIDSEIGKVLDWLDSSGEHEPIITALTIRSSSSICSAVRITPQR
jgi:hypothetical protein